MKILAPFLLAFPVYGGLLSGPHFVGSTPTQVVVHYTADNGPCGVTISPTANALDNTLFPGSPYTGQIKMNWDYTAVIGKRTSSLGTDGRMYSLALQNETPYQVTVTCFGTAAGTVRAPTTPTPFGAAATDPPPLDPNTPGGMAWPTVKDWTSTSDVYIDPQTGQPLTMLTPARQATNDQTTAVPFPSVGALDANWSLTAGALPASYTWPGSGSTGNLFLRAEGLIGVLSLQWQWGVSGFSMDWFEPTVTGSIANGSCTSGSTGLDACKIQVALTNNGVSATSNWLDCELNQAGKSCVLAPLHTPIFEEWRNTAYPIARPDFVTTGAQTAMVMTVASDGSTLTWVSGPSPLGYWQSGAMAKIGTTYCEITGVKLGNAKVVNMADPSCFLSLGGTNQNVTFPTVGVLIRKKTATTSVVTITAGSYKYGLSDSMQNPDTGSVQSCSPPVDGGVLCTWGTSGGTRYLFFLKPDGTTNIIGRLGFSGKGTGYKWNSIVYTVALAHIQSDPNRFFVTGQDQTTLKEIFILVQLNDHNHTAAAHLTTNSFMGTSGGDTCSQDPLNIYHQTCSLNGYPAGLELTAITPGDIGQDIDSMMGNFTPWFNTTNAQLAFKSHETISGYSNGLLTGFTRAGNSQGAVALVFAFDPGDLNPLHAGSPGGPRIVGVTSTFGDTANNLGAFPARWCVHHAQLNWGFASPIAMISGNSNFNSNSSQNGVGPWTGVLTKADGTALTSINTTDTVIYMKGWATPDPTTGIANSLTDPSPAANEVWPTGLLAPGDYIALASGGLNAIPGGWGSGGIGTLHEVLQILSIDRTNPLWAITVRRGVGQAGGGSGPASLTADGVSTWIFGTGICGCQNFDANYTNGVTGGGYCHWNFTADPTGANPNYSTYLSSGNVLQMNGNFTPACLPGFGTGCLTYGKDAGNQASHETYRPSVYSENLNRLLTPNGKSAYVMRQDTSLGVFTYPQHQQTYQFYSLPTFAGALPGSDDSWNSHNTSGPQSSINPNNNGQILDALPFYNGLDAATFALTYPDGTPTTSTWWFRGTLANASYPDDISGSVVLNRKRWPTWASGGHYIFRDISGPGCSWVDGLAGAYTYAVIRAADECHAGTVPGDILINMPYAFNLGTCPTSFTTMYLPSGGENYDVCIGNSAMWANTATLQVQPNGVGDYTGTAVRRITSGMSIPNRGYPFWTPRATEDGAWVVPYVPWFGMARATLLKTPFPVLPNPDNVTRDYYTPVQVDLPAAPSPATKAWLRFGYEEYGCITSCIPETTRHAYCTSRIEDCIVSAANYSADLANPFQYVTTDAAAGVTCTSGCHFTLPAISGRVLYYWAEYLDNSSALVVANPTVAVPIP